MKEIQLTKGRVAYVSDIDYPEVRKHKWHCYGKGGKYAGTYNYGKRILLHRFIAILKGIGDAGEIDHINGDTSNCTRSNLRVVTRSENNMNCHTVRAKSGVRGVYRSCHRWRAQLGLNGKLINLGTYGTIEEAAKARRKGALKYFGRFANKEIP